MKHFFECLRKAVFTENAGEFPIVPPTPLNELALR